MKKAVFLILTFLVLGLVAYIGYTKFILGRGMKEPLSPIALSKSRVEIECPFYLQGDPLWRDEELGDSGDKLASYGCTVCAASMALGAYEIEINPGDLSRRLNEEGGFTEGGLLIWSSLAKIAGEGYKVEVRNRFDHDYLDSCLDEGNPVIAKVLFDGRIWHWVLIVGRLEDSYLIKDPLNSSGVVKASEVYPDGFYAIRHLRRG